MIESATIDSNILIYAFDPTHAARHHTSVRILTAMFRARSALPLQCLCEFYSVTTRKRLVSQQRAQTIVEDCTQSLKIVAAEPAELAAAIDIHRRFGLQFFDSLLIATAYRAGCTTLISEDMQDGQTIHGVELFNPFSRPPAALDRLLA